MSLVSVLGCGTWLFPIEEQLYYIEGMRAVINAAKAGSDSNVPYWYHFSVRRNPFAVYDANLARLGILHDPLPRLITQFYAQASSILEDIADMRERTTQPRDREESIRRLEQLLGLFEDTHALGKEIIKAVI